jgi:hypothetical protein
VTQPTPSDLENAIFAVYDAPLDQFVGRRDALAKQLRTEKRTEDAARIKALRKPNRMAWVLDKVVRESPTSIEQLIAAIARAQTGGDLRTALGALKEAVRAVAAVGARVAVRAGHPLEPNAIAAAIHAVIGDANAFAELRAGRLVDVPDAGGLDMLDALTIADSPARPTPSSAAPPPSRHASRAEAAKHDSRTADAKAARAELHRVKRKLADARKASEHAAKALSAAREKLDTAERALLDAQADVTARRDEHEQARKEASSAAASLDDAQRAWTLASAN